MGIPKKHIAIFFLALFAGNGLGQEQNSSQPVQPQSPPLGWYQQNSGTTTQVNTLYFLDRDTGWAASSEGLFMTTNSGNTWQLVNSLRMHDQRFIDAKKGWALSDTSLINTSDGGQNWQSVHAPRLGRLQTFGSDTIRIFNNSDPSFAGSNDGGKTWFTDDSSEAMGHGQGGAMHFSDGKHGFFCGLQVGWYGTYPPTIGTVGAGFAYTVNGGKTWKAGYCSILSDLWTIFAIDSQHVLIAGAGKTIAYTTDGGKSWYNSVNPDHIYVERFYFLNEQLGYAVGFGGDLGFTSDGGKSWHGQNSTVKEDLYSVYFIDSLTGWASGDGGVVIHTINGGKSWVRQTLPKPLDVAVSPEPFATKTTLSYSIPKAASVKVTMYDIMGKEVFRISSEGIQDSGPHSIVLSGASLPAGVYYFILEAGGFTGMGKVTKIVP